MDSAKCDFSNRKAMKRLLNEMEIFWCRCFWSVYVILFLWLYHSLSTTIVISLSDCPVQQLIMLLLFCNSCAHFIQWATFTYTILSNCILLHKYIHVLHTIKSNGYKCQRNRTENVSGYRIFDVVTNANTPSLFLQSTNKWKKAEKWRKEIPTRRMGSNQLEMYKRNWLHMCIKNFWKIETH